MLKLLDDHLFESGIEDSLRHLINYISRAGKYINHHLQTGDLGYADTENKSGEKQLALDVFSNQIILDNLSICRLVAAAASEEEDDIKTCEHDDSHGSYAVCFDPLDGSSLAETNLSVGSIFGIYEGNSFVGKTGREQVAAVYLVYGPRTTLVYSVGKGTHEFTLNDVGEYTLTKESINVGDVAKNFAPGNLRAAATDENYKKLMDSWIGEEYTLRYSGGMVPDINHIFMKGEGVFVYPPQKEKYPNGKLRLLFEANPIAYLMENAGGLAQSGSGSILDVKIEELHQRIPVYFGSKNEVEKAVKIIHG